MLVCSISQFVAWHSERPEQNGEKSSCFAEVLGFLQLQLCWANLLFDLTAVDRFHPVPMVIANASLSPRLMLEELKRIYGAVMFDELEIGSVVIEAEMYGFVAFSTVGGTATAPR